MVIYFEPLVTGPSMPAEFSRRFMGTENGPHLISAQVISNSSKNYSSTLII